MSELSVGDGVTVGGPAAGGGGAVLMAGARLGQYRIMRLLGRGGMGEVYEAEHAALGRRYALKLLPIGFASQPGALERLKREARVMANLLHPNIVRVDDFGEADGRHWLRMELAVGVEAAGRRVTTLQVLAEAGGGRLEQGELARALDQILAALEHAHGRGTVHRDIKPSNVLLFSEGEQSVFKLADFGLVRLVGEEWLLSQAQLSLGCNASLGDRVTMMGGGAEGTSTRSLLGTYEYMSPEQRRGEEATVRSDLYSAGLLAFRLLTGQNPGLKPPSRIDRAVLPAWDGLLERALEEDPAERWPDAAAMRVALREGVGVGGGGSVAVRRPGAESARLAACGGAAAPLEAGTARTVDVGGGMAFELVWCPPGTFLMGSPAYEAERGADEARHEVTLTRGFWMGKVPVTQRQWETVMGMNPSHFKAGKCFGFGGKTQPELPVEKVSWVECHSFVGRLNELFAASGDTRPPVGGLFRLPTEAEWEYACRAGATGAYAGNLDEMGWHSSNSLGTTHPVGQKKPNAWGLYDMHGNVWEWCRDLYGGYSSGKATDPMGPIEGRYRVFRGGSWFIGASFCRSAKRNMLVPSVAERDLGFRVVLATVP